MDALWPHHHNGCASTYARGTKGGGLKQSHKKGSRTKGDWQITHTNHPAYYWRTWYHGVMQPNNQMGAKNNTVYSQLCHKEQYSRYNARHPTSGDIHANTEGCKATNSDTACYKCTHMPQAGVTEPSIHPHSAVTIRGQKRPIKRRTLCFANGTSIDQWDNLQLQMMHNPATSETWQTVFGKDFSGMAQGNHKTGQKGTNSCL